MSEERQRYICPVCAAGGASPKSSPVPNCHRCVDDVRMRPVENGAVFVQRTDANKGLTSVLQQEDGSFVFKRGDMEIGHYKDAQMMAVHLAFALDELVRGTASLRELEPNELIERGDIFWGVDDADVPPRFHPALSIGYRPRESEHRYFRPSLGKVKV